MAIHRPRLCLVCYDIADPRRLGKVHRHLREQGLPLQYSVFSVRLSQRQQAALLAELAGLIDADEDDVRLYPLPDAGERIHLGQQSFPDDIFLFAAGGDLLLREAARSAGAPGPATPAKSRAVKPPRRF